MFKRQKRPAQDLIEYTPLQPQHPSREAGSYMGAKQPVLPTEELWQLHLRDRSLVGRLRTSQLGWRAVIRGRRPSDAVVPESDVDNY
jgi:hypothetical protein